MFGAGLPLCTQSMMRPYDVPVSQPYPYPVSVPQPYIQNMVQHVDMPVSHTVQPVIVPTPFGVPVPHPVPVPVDRPCAVPVPHPVPFMVERPCAVPYPVGVPVPQPYAVPQPIYVQEQVGVPFPVPVPVPVQTPQQYQYNLQEEYYAPPSYRHVEHIIEEPIRIKHHRRHRRCRSYTPIPAPLPPIIIPIPIQAPAVVQAQPQLQVTEYIQDIYPPAEVYTNPEPIGYVVSNSPIQQPNQILRQQTSLNCQPGIVISPASLSQSSSYIQQRVMQQLPNFQIVQQPFAAGSGAVPSLVIQ